MHATLAVLLFAFVAIGHSNSLINNWESFKYSHGKSYNKPEESYRRRVFEMNSEKIDQHNKLYEQGLVTFKMAMNRFGDLMPHEFNGMYKGLRMPSGNALKSDDAPTFIKPDSSVSLPESMDWRPKGAVTPVKNQKQCGSCWAFSATGSLEGQHFRKTGKLVSLSEQNLVDCSRDYGNMGCDGGLMDLAFKYIKENGGIDSEDSYPYRAEDDQCTFKKSSIGATDKGYVDLPQQDEDALKAAVATVGPISIAIDASNDSFQFYHSGIYYEPACNATTLDHGVLAVGYGNENGQDYWLVKNSWDTTWGDEGYIKMLRNKDNHCGVASMASYPLV